MEHFIAVTDSIATRLFQAGSRVVVNLCCLSLLGDNIPFNAGALLYVMIGFLRRILSSMNKFSLGSVVSGNKV